MNTYMKSKALKIAVVAIMFLWSFDSYAPPPGGPPPAGAPPAGSTPAGTTGSGPPCWPPPCVPIDGGLGILIAAGAALGARKIYTYYK
jgi:hypothetical protein